MAMRVCEHLETSAHPAEGRLINGIGGSERPGYWETCHHCGTTRQWRLKPGIDVDSGPKRGDRAVFDVLLHEHMKSHGAPHNDGWGFARRVATLTLTLNEETLRALACLQGPLVGDESVLAQAREALLHLAHSACDGVGRPGAWERGWVTQAFGDGFEHRLVPDDDCEWRELPADADELDGDDDETEATHG